MKLATWNVNSLKVRLPRLLELLEAHTPDVVLLQETKCAPDAFPALELDAAGYRAVHHSGGRWAGVAILARGEEPADVAVGLPDEPAVDEARWIEATLAGVRVVSVYVPNGRAPDTPTYDDKLRFLDAMAARIAALSGEPLVVAGDFNVCPADLDVYDPVAFVGATHVTAPERERFQALLDAGTVDAFRELHPDEPGFTWWDYRQGHFHRKMGLRIDAHLVSAPLAAKIESCGIDRDFRKGAKPSDHAPLLLELG
ncbi:MAG TPA: exodeoxyribonuclease III [Thermoleophilaceae bacterium]|nr:exodeoxyribonuclease III [Thermoleophilaceae bacterium]